MRGAFVAISGLTLALATSPASGGVRLTAGRIDEAIREFRAGLAAAPSFYQFYWMAGAPCRRSR